jgi:transcriptional regulator with XRE-family HTH domain
MSDVPRLKEETGRHQRRSFRLGEKRNAVGERIRALRKIGGITQEMLAAKCSVLGWGIDRQIVAHIESGSREVSDLELRVFCYALKVTPNDLLAWS